MHDAARGDSTPNDLRDGLSRLAEHIRRRDSFLVATHVQPDGDGIGSLLAMLVILRGMSKKALAVWGEQGAIPRQYGWLPGVGTIHHGDVPPGYDTLICLDCASKQRLGVVEAAIGTFDLVINIDHHLDNGMFGHENVVDSDISSTSEIIFHLAKTLGVGINKDMADCLYAGIVTDTGRFQYSNTTAATLRVAAALVELGARPRDVFQKVYEERPLSTVLLLGRVLANTRYDQDSGVIWSVVGEDDLKASGSDMADGENLIDYLRAVSGIRVAVLIKQFTDGKVKVSLRSRGEVDVARLAGAFGGGGHHDAAGFSSTGSPTEILAAIVAALPGTVAGGRQQGR